MNNLKHVVIKFEIYHQKQGNELFFNTSRNLFQNEIKSLCETTKAVTHTYIYISYVNDIKLIIILSE